MNKKSCRIITFHTPINYGALLQATALFTYVSKQFKDTLIIDYNTKQLRKKYPFFRKSTGIIRYFWFVYDFLFLPLKAIKTLKFKIFLKNIAILQ